MSELSPEYLEALSRLGEVTEWLRRRHGMDAVLVGGAVVEFYTGGGYQTGDFDMVFPDKALFAEAVARHGFLPVSGRSMLVRGWFHPETPSYSVELVAGRLFDGHCDTQRCILVDIRENSGIILPPIEDLIADRLGQYGAVPANPDPAMLNQARLLLSLAGEVDWSYLRRRVSEDQGDISLLAGIRPLKEGGI